MSSSPAFGEHVGQRAHVGALRQRVGQRRNERAVDDDQAAAAERWPPCRDPG